MENNSELRTNNESVKQKPLKILVVEDNKEIADLVKDILEGEGHDVIALTSKEEALVLLRKKKEEGFSFDWVITNRGFAGRLEKKMDGFELGEKIVKENLGNPYVTMITRSAYNVMPEQLRKNGINNLMDKPFTSEQLRDLVRTVKQPRMKSESLSPTK